MARVAIEALWRSKQFPGRWRVQRWAEKNFGHYASYSPRRISMAGFSFLVDPRASLETFMNGITPATAVERILRTYVKPGQAVLDVGANIGWTARLMSYLVGAEGRVFAFEPTARAFANLEGNVADAPLKNIFPYRLAVTDAPGRVRLNVKSEDASALATMRAPKDEDQSGVSVEVEAITLDGWLDRLPAISFVKIDVEGAEYHVLKGMSRLIARDRPAIALELTDSWLRELGASARELMHYLEAFGYRSYRIDDVQGLVPLSSALEGQVDAVFLPS